MVPGLPNEFEFRAELLFVQDGGVRRAWRFDEPLLGQSTFGIQMFRPILHVPARWFTDVIEVERTSHSECTHRRLPVPNWSPDPQNQ